MRDINKDEDYPDFKNEAKQYQYNRLIEEFNKKGISIDKLKVDEQYTSKFIEQCVGIKN